MGKRPETTSTSHEVAQIAAPPPAQLHPRPRQVTFWLPSTELDGSPGVRPWVVTTAPDTYLVFSVEMALQCEVAGVPYTLINPSPALAVDVSDHVPGEAVRRPAVEWANAPALDDARATSDGWTAPPDGTS